MNIFKETTGQGEDVVLLHGWGGCDHKHMQPIVEQLSSRYCVTNFDLPGVGKSDWHSDIRNIHDTAKQIIPHLPKQAIYVGWSFGGLIAMSIAARYPERMSRFIGITTTPKFIEGDNWPGISQPGFKATFVLGIKERGYKAFMQQWYDSEFSTFETKPPAYHQLINILETDSSKVNLDVLVKGVDICDSTDLRIEFKEIQSSIDLICVENDETIPLASLKYIKKLNTKTNIHIMPGTSHMPFWTNPTEFNKVLNSIL